MRKAQILFVEDEPDLRDGISELLNNRGYEVLAADGVDAAIRILDRHFVDLMVLDQKMPGRSGLELIQHARERYPGIGSIFFTGNADLPFAIDALRNGAIDLVQKSGGGADELLSALARGLRRTEADRQARYAGYLAQHQVKFAEIIGDSQALKAALRELRVATPVDATVLLLGETGVGKELAAAALHQGGPRARCPYVAVSVAGVPEGLLESTLFGYVKGAYTGAGPGRVGIFEAAHRGTVFLDEIAELPLPAQTRLLRVLQERKVARVGDHAEIPVDVRVVAATNRDLGQEVREGRFREDLYHRLNVLAVTLPPLRERHGDIPLLANYFLGSLRRRHGKAVTEISPDAMAMLERYRWPGNVRELSNAIERAVLMSEGEVLGPETFQFSGVSGGAALASTDTELPYRDAIDHFETTYFSELLRRFSGNHSKAARFAGIDRKTLLMRLDKLGLR